jgi:hypothetical protein
MASRYTVKRSTSNRPTASRTRISAKRPFLEEEEMEQPTQEEEEEYRPFTQPKRTRITGTFGATPNLFPVIPVSENVTLPLVSATTPIPLPPPTPFARTPFPTSREQLSAVELNTTPTIELDTGTAFRRVSPVRQDYMDILEPTAQSGALMYFNQAPSNIEPVPANQLPDYMRANGFTDLDYEVRTINNNAVNPQAFQNIDWPYLGNWVIHTTPQVARLLTGPDTGFSERDNVIVVIHPNVYFAMYENVYQ